MSNILLRDMFDVLKKNIAENEADFCHKSFGDFDKYNLQFGRLQGKREALNILRRYLEDLETKEEE